MAGQKRIHSAFSRALIGRGFLGGGDSFCSKDGIIKVEFRGSTWNLFIDDKHILEHPMEAGSMKKLEQTVSTYKRGSSIGTIKVKAAPKKPKKESGVDPLLPKLDRIEIRKNNKGAVTKEQEALKQVNPGSTQINDFIAGILKFGFMPTQELDVESNRKWREYKFSIYTVIPDPQKGCWKLFSSDRILGEGILSLQSVEVIEKIIRDLG